MAATNAEGRPRHRRHLVALLARRRRLPSVDPQRMRADIDRLIDPTSPPSGV